MKNIKIEDATITPEGCYSDVVKDSLPIVQFGTYNVTLVYDKTISLIFGVTGQTGSYLAEKLLEKGHKVIGIARRTSTPNTGRISHILGHENFSLLTGDVCDFSNILTIIKETRPNWIFNLAAQSHVGTSFTHACTSLDITAQGCVNILEAVKQLRECLPDDVRVYQASSSEMFGKAYDDKSSKSTYSITINNGEEIITTPIFPNSRISDRYQDENTKFDPQSPYAIAKVAAHNYCRLYRDAYGMDIRPTILMNHESPRRGEEFVTRKITKWIGKYKKWSHPLFELGQWAVQDWDNRLYNSLCDPEGFPKLRLGNLDASRDWGHCRDYISAMILIMEADTPAEYVVATGETYTIKDFLNEAFKAAGLGDWTDYVVVDDDLKRPCEVPYLRGDSQKIREELGWKPTIGFQELVKEMVDNDTNND